MPYADLEQGKATRKSWTYFLMIHSLTTFKFNQQPNIAKTQQHSKKYQKTSKTTNASISTSSNYSANLIQQNFRGIKIFNANLIDKLKEKFIPATATKLDFQDDAKVMQHLRKSWGDSNTDYIDGIADTFKSQKGSFSTISIEDTSKPFSDNIKSIIKTDIENDTMFIDFLQSAPDIADNAQSKIRGAGELAVYSAVKEAKEKGLKKIELTSGSATSNTFYDKIGFDCVYVSYDPDSRLRHGKGLGDLIAIGGCYELPSEKFDSFINRVEAKYNIKN